MRLLIFNHLFDQDIDSLLHAGKEHELRILPLGPVVYLAQIYFPPKVFGGLTEFHDLKYVQNREKWVKEIESIMEKIFENFQFDAFILPSDTYFYIRPAIQWAQKNGIPCINVQKETSISPWTMESDSKGIKLFFPFICDIMTVCSHRHKEFWINAGADPNKIIITGQPRFDFYKKPNLWHSLETINSSINKDKRKTILFFSYDFSAYVPEDIGYTFSNEKMQTWAQLHQETLQALLDLVIKGGYRLLIKEHPQQGTGLSEQLKKCMGTDKNLHKNVFIFPRLCDTRQLIINADIVVGFQTTALYEAMLAKKIVIYTFWGHEVESLKDHLLQFHTYPKEAIFCARSPEDLKSIIGTSSLNQLNENKIYIRKKIWEEHLGQVDGLSSEKVLQIIHNYLTKVSYDKGKRNINIDQPKDRLYLTEWLTFQIMHKIVYSIKFFIYPHRNHKKLGWICRYALQKVCRKEIELAIKYPAMRP